eukprot:RCo015291
MASSRAPVSPLRPGALIRIGLPKGSLQDSTFELLKKAGWDFSVNARSYYPTCDDPELDAMLLRPQEMSRYVERGALDLAITGLDWTVENGSDVEIMQRLSYAKASRSPVRWVLAVPDNSSITSVKDLEGLTISTEVVELTRKYLARHGVNATVQFSHGATEVKVPHLADAIVEITETGSSLKANRLKIIDTIMESVTVIVANKDSLKDPVKKAKMDAVCLMLKGAFDAGAKVLLKFNAKEADLPQILEVLASQSLHSPTINHLAEAGWIAVETVVDKSFIRNIIPRLKAVGAQGLIEIPINMIVM